MSRERRHLTRREHVVGEAIPLTNGRVLPRQQPEPLSFGLRDERVRKIFRGRTAAGEIERIQIALVEIETVHLPVVVFRRQRRVRVARIELPLEPLRLQRHRKVLMIEALRNGVGARKSRCIRDPSSSVDDLFQFVIGPLRIAAGPNIHSQDVHRDDR